MKVLIAVPSFDSVYTDFAMSLAALMHFEAKDSLKRPIKIGLQNVKNTIIADARRMLVEQAFTAEADGILFLDSDMVFPANTLQRLVRQGTSRAIIGTIYAKRYAPHEPLGLKVPGASTVKDMVAMQHIPLGCAYIPLQAFREVELPWFDFKADAYGEDTYFCHKARKAGFDIFADVKLSRELGHITNKAIRLP